MKKQTKQTEETVTIKAPSIAKAKFKIVATAADRIDDALASAPNEEEKKQEK